MQVGADRGARMGQGHPQQLGTHESIVEPLLQVCALVFRAWLPRRPRARLSPSNLPSQGRALNTRCLHLDFIVPKSVGSLHQHADVIAAVALEPAVRAAFFKQDFKLRSAKSFDESPPLVLAERAQNPARRLISAAATLPGSLAAVVPALTEYGKT